jgi:hypothetical protein
MGFYNWRFRISNEAARQEAARRQPEQQPVAKPTTVRPATKPVWVHHQQGPAYEPTLAGANENVTTLVAKLAPVRVRA